MTKYRLLCTDLDGTLLTEEKKIKKQDVDAFRKAAGEGITIALITNRMPAATKPVEKMLGIPCIWTCGYYSISSRSHGSIAKRVR